MPRLAPQPGPPNPLDSDRTRGLASAARRALLASAALTAGAALVAADGGTQPTHAPPDPAAGLDYILHGDYIGSGIPYDVWLGVRTPAERAARPLVERRGLNAVVPHGMNAFTTPEGAAVVAGASCLGCHAQELNGELVIGLGNSLSDWTEDGRFPAALLTGFTVARHGPASPETRAIRRFARGVAALDGRMETPFRGVNPAFRLEELAAAHRDPATLRWQDNPLYDVSRTWAASDVPPWWHMKKKRTLYYNGMGQGDASRLLQQITVVGIEDVRHAEAINDNMRDVVAYLRSLEPPPYPGEIDPELARLGEAVFKANCAACHGTYGDDWTYPNRVVPVEEVGTDPLYADALMRSGLIDWYRDSWFAHGEHDIRNPDAAESYVMPTRGYIAPPLDGVWATAPYFHNGSVPTLAAVLDSAERPERWRRSFDSHDYDPDAPGWKHQPVDSPIGPDGRRDVTVYDTTLPGYGNGGHTYGDHLRSGDRAALIEYLKTL